MNDKVNGLIISINTEIENFVGGMGLPIAKFDGGSLYKITLKGKDLTFFAAKKWTEVINTYSHTVFIGYTEKDYKKNILIPKCIYADEAKDFGNMRLNDEVNIDFDKVSKFIKSKGLSFVGGDIWTSGNVCEILQKSEPFAFITCGDLSKVNKVYDKYGLLLAVDFLEGLK